MVLPHERVFPVQIGSQLFRLSGASISSDGKCLQDIFAMSPVFSGGKVSMYTSGGEIRPGK
jgi:hypothetical protein